jgi:S1-C subfamily serine protease
MKSIESWAPLVKIVAPAVVNISGKHPDKEYKMRPLGSGFLINKKGHIVTADHILKDGFQIIITLLDNRRFDAKIIGRNSSANVALLKINAGEDLPIALLGDSDKLRVGDYIIGIGNPFGSWPTASAGIVGGMGGPGVLKGGVENGFIQTDASINPGNAGGPMCNIAGEVVGINTALIKSGPNVGFANPINAVKIVLNTFVNE